MNKKIKKISKRVNRKSLYLDYASATPLDQKISKRMFDINRLFSNPSSIHKGGLHSREVIEDSRLKIAKLISAHSDEIIFTGSGTESDALAIIGTINSYEKIFANLGKNLPHIITTAIEHPAVIENCKVLERENRARVTYIAPNENGLINPKDIRDALHKNTILVSIMYANNEIGTIQPIQEIAKEIRFFKKKNNSIYPVFHTDACQAMNYLFTENIEKLGVDLMTWNSSKIYGPKGIGILYKKRNVKIKPIYVGGGQEFGFRSGTENISLVLGSALALEDSYKIKEKESKRLINIRDYGIKKLLSLSRDSNYRIILNGDEKNRLPNNINISVSGISSELLVIELDAKGIYVSSKSACKSDQPDESYVIEAINKAKGLKKDSIDGSLRISLGRQTTKGDMDRLFNSLKQVLYKYKALK